MELAWPLKTFMQSQMLLIAKVIVYKCLELEGHIHWQTDKQWFAKETTLRQGDMKWSASTKTMKQRFIWFRNKSKRRDPSHESHKDIWWIRQEHTEPTKRLAVTYTDHIKYKKHLIHKKELRLISLAKKINIATNRFIWQQPDKYVRIITNKYNLAAEEGNSKDIHWYIEPWDWAMWLYRDLHMMTVHANDTSGLAYGKDLWGATIMEPTWMIA